jgi:trehalose 6-phosphate synthase/phosphatase
MMENGSNKNGISSPETGRLVVVSNRLPMTLTKERGSWKSSRSPGGLATAMDPLLERNGGIWIGWSGDSSAKADPRRQAVLDEWREKENCIAVDLPADVVKGYYEGFSNATLWFLFHSFPGLFKFNTNDWRDYVRANEAFRDAVVKELQPGDLVWIHDYQLMLLPKMIREAVPDARIGFFLHIPFPSSDVFRVLPRREEVLKGLLGSDYISFHTHRYLQNFRSSLLRVHGIRSTMDRIGLGSRQVRMEAQPIGIAPLEFREILDQEKTKEIIAGYRKNYDGVKLLVGVDRLDITKGLPERLRAFQRFLTKNRRMQGKVTLIQIAVPSRGNIPIYKDLQQEVDELVGQINGRFSTPSWSPIVYMKRNLSQEELAALYSVADAALVTPLRDGQNLVAKEYVACKQNGDGVLLLSEFAGAAAEMGEAIQINPYDEERTADAIARALSMPVAEKRERMAALYKRVVRNDVFTWGARFVRNLAEAADSRMMVGAGRPQQLPLSEIEAAYETASKRLILLDYDGTLVGYAQRAEDAIPPLKLKRILAGLAADPRNTAVIVSGRAKTDLERWFGKIPNLWLAAEHGAVMRRPWEKEWSGSNQNVPDNWKKQVFEVLEHFADRTPGSYVEEKELSLVWHYRMSDPEFGEWLANELNSTLDELLADTQLRAIQGRKNVEVKLMWATKADVLTQMTQDVPGFDFMLAAGDDTTDEDLFAKMPPDSWTVHVGGEHSLARFRMRGYREMRDLLATLADTSITAAERSFHAVS